jgi:hypothetical protein
MGKWFMSKGGPLEIPSPGEREKRGGEGERKRERGADI